MLTSLQDFTTPPNDSQPFLWKEPFMSQYDPKPLREKSRPTSTPATGPSLGNNERLLESKALPLEWLLNPEKGDSVSERVLARLVQSEAHELNPHLRSDYHQAWLTVYYASLGNPIAFIEASYRAVGCHPDKVWPRIVENRKALLGSDYSRWYDEAGNALSPEPLYENLPVQPSSPKKPSQSTRKQGERNVA